MQRELAWRGVLVDATSKTTAIPVTRRLDGDLRPCGAQPKNAVLARLLGEPTKTAPSRKSKLHGAAPKAFRAPRPNHRFRLNY